MTKYPTAKVTELYDPELQAPPRGQVILLISPGGLLLKGAWFDGCLAWGYMPKIPESVKLRQLAKIDKTLHSSESNPQ